MVVGHGLIRYIPNRMQLTHIELMEKPFQSLCLSRRYQFGG